MMARFEIPRFYNVIREAGKQGRDQSTYKLVDKDGRITVSAESKIMRAITKGLNNIDKEIPVYPYWDIGDISDRAFIVTPIDEPYNFVYNEPWCVSAVYMERGKTVYATIYSVVEDILYYTSVGKFSYKLQTSLTKLAKPQKQESFCLCVDEPVVDSGYRIIQELPGASQANKLYVGKSFNEAAFKFLNGSCGMMIYRSPVREREKYPATLAILKELDVPYRVINGMAYYSNVKEAQRADDERIKYEPST